MRKPIYALVGIPLLLVLGTGVIWSRAVGLTRFSNKGANSNTFTGNGVFLRLDGQWQHWDKLPNERCRGELTLFGCVPPNSTRIWKVESMGAPTMWDSGDKWQGPTQPRQTIGVFTCTLPCIRNASLLNAHRIYSQGVSGDKPTAKSYGAMYFALLEYDLDSNGKETLISRTPLALSASFQDKGSQEKLYGVQPVGGKRAESGVPKLKGLNE